MSTKPDWEAGVGKGPEKVEGGVPVVSCAEAGLGVTPDSCVVDSVGRGWLPIVAERNKNLFSQNLVPG